MPYFNRLKKGLKKGPPKGVPFPAFRKCEDLTAPARTPTTHAPVATPVSGHDRTTCVAGGGVAQVNKLLQRVGRVVQPTIYERGAFSHWLLAFGQTALRRSRFAAGLAEC
jgi:hypothetical protein